MQALITRFIIGLILRHGATFIGGVLLSPAVASALGGHALTASQAAEAAGAIMALIGVAWSAYNKTPARVERAADHVQAARAADADEGPFGPRPPI